MTNIINSLCLDELAGKTIKGALTTYSNDAILFAFEDSTYLFIRFYVDGDYGNAAIENVAISYLIDEVPNHELVDLGILNDETIAEHNKRRIDRETSERKRQWDQLRKEFGEQ